MASVKATAARIFNGKNEHFSYSEIIKGANMEPILENMMDIPTPAFLKTVGYNSSVKR